MWVKFQAMITYRISTIFYFYNFAILFLGYYLYKDILHSLLLDSQLTICNVLSYFHPCLLIFLSCLSLFCSKIWNKETQRRYWPNDEGKGSDMLTDFGKTEKDCLFGVWFIHSYTGTPSPHVHTCVFKPILHKIPRDIYKGVINIWNIKINRAIEKGPIISRRCIFPYYWKNWCLAFLRCRTFSVSMNLLINLTYCPCFYTELIRVAT